MRYRCRRPAPCPRLTLVHHWRRRQWEDVTVFETSDNGDTIYINESRFKWHPTDGRANVTRKLKSRSKEKLFKWIGQRYMLTHIVFKKPLQLEAQ